MDRVAVVTGAGRGIGRAIAAALHRGGHRVALLDVAGAADAARELDPTSAAGFTVDVRDPAAVRAAAGAVADRFGPADVLVNNAARTVSRSVWDIAPDEWDDVLATNARGVLLATQAFAPAMRERGWGRVVNLASLAGQQGGTVAGAHYAASKAGVLVLTKIFARELAPHGVTVNAVAPAAVRTPVLDDLPSEQIERMAATIPVRRLGRAEEVAALVAHLCSDEAGYITGATLDVNGGLSMR
ncbi:MAG TPA: SDR family oxidoreductase [Pseudonocardia sp.]|nr:SDR family oxidoreductase [Pseudonocardia sp.]